MEVLAFAYTTVQPFLFEPIIGLGLLLTAFWGLIVMAIMND